MPSSYITALQSQNLTTMDEIVASRPQDIHISYWDVHKEEIVEMLIHRPQSCGDWMFLHFCTPVQTRGFVELETSTCLVFALRTPQ